jgi:hypothetical protein
MNAVLQAATTIAKTTQTLIGSEISCRGQSYLTLYIDYVKGEETGLIITPLVLRETGGTEYAYAERTATGGAITLTDTKITLTASKSSYMTFDVTGIEIMKFTQGGSNNDGVTLGTLAAAYSLKE